MAVRKKKTENQKAFQRERRRLQQAVRRAEKQGYIFPEDVVPKMPKRVTKKALETIKATKPSSLYKSAEFVYFDTGEVVPAEQRKQEVKKQGIAKAVATRKQKKENATSIPQFGTEEKQEKRKPKEKEEPSKKQEYYPTMDIIELIKERIMNTERIALVQVPIEARKSYLIDIIDDNVNYYEMNWQIEDYVNHLKKHEEEISSLLYAISYDSDDRFGTRVGNSFVRLARLLNVTALTPAQAENMSAISEFNEDYNDIEGE